MLSDIIEISSGFQSSVNIAYDLKNEDKIKSFIPTTSSLELISNILTSANPNSTQRAKILTGAYGRGKSHILLVALSMLYCQSKKSTYKNLLDRMKEYNEDIYKNADVFLKTKIKLLPVIISGSCSSLTQSFMNALQQALNSNNMDDIMPDTHFKAAKATIEKWAQDYPNTYELFTEKINIKIDDFIACLDEHDTMAYQEFMTIYPQLTAGSVFNPFVGFDVADLYEEVSKAIKEKGFDGIYVVYDEFGKYLETSIATATESDTKLLQDFAEKCNRSGKNQMHLMLICHKDIANYIDMNLPQDKVDGWRGISGRFEHINLHNNYSQMYEIIAAVISKKTNNWKPFYQTHSDAFDNLAKRYSSNKLINTDFNLSLNAVTSCYPLHPSTMYILPRLSEKVAQNERTLFTFLSANHKNTLVEYIEKSTDDFPFVTPDYLYDYFEQQFKKELSSTEIHRTYKLAATVLKKVERGSLQSKIIKTIALMYIIEQFEKFPPTVDNIMDVFIDTVSDPKEITDALTDLVQNACIVYLKRSNSYLKLKESSGVNVEEQINERVEILKDEFDVKEVLNKLNIDNCLYPVRHNDENCITRYFEFKFIDSKEYHSNNVVSDDANANGVVQALFFESDDDFKSFTLKNQNINEENVVTIVPKTYTDISSFAFEYTAIQELKLENSDDDILCDEYDVYLEDLDVMINNFISGFTHPEMQKVHYYHNGKKVKLLRKAQLSALLSEICDKIYPNTPIINNESVNKNELPTVAVNSRTKLVSALIENDIITENLGLSGTGQDVSIMRSTLIQTGILAKADGKYSLNLSPDNDKILNVLVIIQNFFRNTAINGETSFSNLYNTLTSADIGIGLKKGVIPIFIAVVLNTMKKDIVLRCRNEEVRITADLLNSINENPADYSAIMEDWNDEKGNYLQHLNEIFKDYIIESEKTFNSFVYLSNAMNRWYMDLPRCAKDMTVVYNTDKAINKSQVRFINALKQPSNNARQFLIEELPKIFNQKYAQVSVSTEIAKTKALFENGKNALEDRIITITKDIFTGKRNATLSSTLKDWIETLKEDTIQHQFQNNENAILTLISDISNDEKTFVSRLAKEIVGLRIDDWNAGSLNQFCNGLKNFYISINSYNSEIHINNESHKTNVSKLSFIDDNGNEVIRVFEKKERSKKANLLYGDITGAIEDIGQSVSAQEKRQVLIDILEQLCK